MKKTLICAKHIFPFSIVLFWSHCQKPTEPDQPKDTTPPQVLIVQPTDGDTLTTPMDIKVLATDNNAVKEVNFLVYDDVVGRSESAPYIHRWNLIYWADGNFHDVSANAVDVSNNIGYSDTVSVFVPKTVTGSPILISPNNDTIFTNTNSIEFIWRSLPDAQQYQLWISTRSDFFRTRIFCKRD